VSGEGEEQAQTQSQTEFLKCFNGPQAGEIRYTFSGPHSAAPSCILIYPY